MEKKDFTSKDAWLLIFKFSFLIIVSNQFIKSFITSDGLWDLLISIVILLSGFFIQYFLFSYKLFLRPEDKKYFIEKKAASIRGKIFFEDHSVQNFKTRVGKNFFFKVILIIISLAFIIILFKEISLGLWININFSTILISFLIGISFTIDLFFIPLIFSIFLIIKTAIGAYSNFSFSTFLLTILLIGEFLFIVLLRRSIWERILFNNYKLNKSVLFLNWLKPFIIFSLSMMLCFIFVKPPSFSNSTNNKKFNQKTNQKGNILSKIVEKRDKNNKDLKSWMFKLKNSNKPQEKDLDKLLDLLNSLKADLDKSSKFKKNEKLKMQKIKIDIDERMSEINSYKRKRGGIKRLEQYDMDRALDELKKLNIEFEKLNKDIGKTLGEIKGFNENSKQEFLQKASSVENLSDSEKLKNKITKKKFKIFKNLKKKNLLKAILMFIPLFIILLFIFKKKKTTLEVKEKKDLKELKNIHKNEVFEFKKSFKSLINNELIGKRLNSEIIVKVYSFLLDHLQKRGYGKLPGQTPDEFSIYLIKKAGFKSRDIFYINEIFCDTFYGSKIISKKEFSFFLRSVASVGNSIKFKS